MVGRRLKRRGFHPWQKSVVCVDENHFRKTEVENLCGDATKAKEKLGWSPTISFDKLVKEMVYHDITDLQYTDYKDIHL